VLVYEITKLSVVDRRIVDDVIDIIVGAGAHRSSPSWLRCSSVEEWAFALALLVNSVYTRL
jgi:hypothetical protein